MTAITTTTAKTDSPPASAPHDTQVVVHPIRDDADRAAWAAYVQHDADGTLFHHPLWAQAVGQAFGHQCHTHIARRGERVVGVLPMMGVDSFLAGRLLVSMPYATYGGILADNELERDALGGAAMRLCYEHGMRQLQLRSAVPMLPGLACDERYAAFVRPLPSSLDGLGKFLPRKARAAARQARERDGLTVTHDQDLLKTVYGLYARSMRRLGSVNYPYAFFETLVQRLRNRAWVTVVWHDKLPIAGLLSFVWRDTVMPYFIGVDERAPRNGATNLVYLATMERAVKQQLMYFDFGRTRKDNAGPFAFKRNQGFEPRTLGYQHFTPLGQSAPDLTPANPRFSLARRVWRHLPLPITRAAGAWLSRALPG